MKCIDDSKMKGQKKEKIEKVGGLAKVKNQN